MSEAPLISVIIPTYNTARLIERTLHSVATQHGGFPYEIILVDDASSDNTLQVVENLKLPTLRILRSTVNSGPAAARNRGLQVAIGEFCAFLDGDDYWLPDFFLETLDFLRKNPAAVAVSVGQIHRIIGKPDRIVPSGVGKEKPKDAILLDDFYDFWSKHNHVCTGSVMMRTAVVQATGGQREDLRVCEDLEFWALLATYGSWGIIPEVLFVSDGGAATRAQGWLTKNMRRWQSAVEMECWHRRIMERVSPQFMDAYRHAEGRIAKNMAYSMIMSGRDASALATVRQYGAYFPQDKVARLFRFCASSRILWAMMARWVRYRETNREL